VHADLPDAERGDEADLLRPQHGAALDHDAAASTSSPCMRTLTALVERAHAHPITGALDQLPGDRRCRRRRASARRHDAQRLAGPERVDEDGPRRQIADDVELATAASGMSALLTA
jgi:hypothetical protein